MKAVLVDEKTQRLYIGKWEDPTIGKDDLLIRVKATALNRADLMQKAGKYPPPPGESLILGLEMAGVVEKIGQNVTKWKEGDRVCALLPGGGYAEKVKIPDGMAIAIPDGLSFEEAAAIPEVFLTAYLNVFILGGFKPGYTAMIHAAAGGVGTAAIQLIKQVGRVIATTNSDAKGKVCRALGADLVVNASTEDFSIKVEQFTEGKGVNVILDPVAASYFEKNLKSLATDGRLIIISQLGGAIVPSVDLRQIMMRRWQIIGSTLRALPVSKKVELTGEFSGQFMPMFKDGRLKPIIDSIYDIENITEAHVRMESNLNAGKIIIRTNFKE